MSDEKKWYCKYCDKTVNKKRKDDHCQIKRHMTKARWHKYFRDVDGAADILKQKYDKGLCTVDEFNKIEQEIYDEIDELDSKGHYYNMPDSD